MCDRVKARKVKDSECENLPENLPFEQAVSSRIANEASNPQDIETTTSMFVRLPSISLSEN